MIRQQRWRELLELHPVRWRDLAPGRAGRVALGIAVPLLIGALTGHVQDGIFAALGALPAGLVSFQGVNRSRMQAVLVASLGIAVSTFVGATLPETWPLRVLLIALWAYVAGLSVVLGTRWNVVAINWAAALLLGEAIPLPPGSAAIRGCLALAGGLFQGGLVALSWTLKPGGEERKGLAASYALLASYASAISGGEVGPPSASGFPAGDILEDANPLLPLEIRVMYVNLLTEAVRLRASLAAVASYAQQGTPSDEIRRFAADMGTALDRIATGLSVSPKEWAKGTEETLRSIARISVPQDARWCFAGEALLGQLRAVTRILAGVEARPATLQVGSKAAPNLPRPPNWLRGALAYLRANASSTTEAGRHALRLAVATGLAELVAGVTGYAYGRWVALTVLLVLKPDYTSTLARGVQRAVGTMVGAGLVVALSHWLHPSWLDLGLAAVLTIALAYLTFTANYLLFSLFLTAFIILMLQLLGLAAFSLAEGRIGATAIGAAWALVVYVVWPTWMGASAPDIFAVLIERDGAYLGTMLEQLAHPDRLDLTRLRREQESARRARSDAQAAAERLLREPAHAWLTADLVRRLMAISARLALDLLAVQTLLEHGVGDPTRAATTRLDALASAFQSAFGQLTAAFRTGSPLEALPPLRPLQRALEEQGTIDPSVLVVTDALVDAVATVGALLPHGVSPAANVSLTELRGRTPWG